MGKDKKNKLIAAGGLLLLGLILFGIGVTLPTSALSLAFFLGGLLLTIMGAIPVGYAWILWQFPDLK
ncbi:hypothetical protein KAU11_07465 [Candidatus Babeliales bacterium]|nr:hypothetical protein [Candidatus Babeliales bacterium]